MSKNQPTHGFNFFRTVKKFFVSAFMVSTFIAYALHERLVSGGGGNLAVTPMPDVSTSQQVIPSPQVAPTDSPFVFPTSAATPAAPKPVPAIPQRVPPAKTAPTATRPAPPVPTAIARGQYMDGTYAGAVVDAFYGMVQVKAVVQNGKLANVQFVQYPNDRRTSVRINSIAMPYLTTEAIQAQSANVDIITGATLTSEAFAQSLQTALDTAGASS